jgi:hypothetical protein
VSESGGVTASVEGSDGRNEEPMTGCNIAADFSGVTEGFGVCSCSVFSLMDGEEVDGM